MKGRFHREKGLPRCLQSPDRPRTAERSKDACTLPATHAQQVDAFYAEIGRLTTHVNWLGKKAASLPYQMRRALIDRPADTHSLGVQARLLSISRTHRSYQPTPPSAREIAIKHRLDAWFTAYPFSGSRKLQVLRELTFGPVARTTIRQYMHEMGIAAIVPGLNLSRRHPAHRVHPYRLRHLAATHPNRVWGVDITYLPTREGWLYLTVVLDLYARRVVGWSMDSTLERKLVIGALKAALNHRQPKACLLHPSDCGNQYARADYQTVPVKAGMTPSMSRKGNCLDNAMMERFFASFKLRLEARDSTHTRTHEAVWSTISNGSIIVSVVIPRWHMSHLPTMKSAGLSSK